MKVLNPVASLRSEDDMNRGGCKSKPQISAPVLLSTTLNPNDADAHRNVSFAMRKSASVSSSLASPSSAPSSNMKLSFKKDLSKKLSAASSLFSRCGLDIRKFYQLLSGKNFPRNSCFFYRENI